MCVCMPAQDLNLDLLDLLVWMQLTEPEVLEFSEGLSLLSSPLTVYLIITDKSQPHFVVEGALELLTLLSGHFPWYFKENSLLFLCATPRWFSVEKLLFGLCCVFIPCYHLLQITWYNYPVFVGCHA